MLTFSHNRQHVHSEPFNEISMNGFVRIYFDKCAHSHVHLYLTALAFENSQLSHSSSPSPLASTSTTRSKEKRNISSLIFIAVNHVIMDQHTSPAPLPQITPIVRITKPHDTAAAAPPSPTPERKLKTKTKIPSLETVIEGDPRAHPSLSPDDAIRPVARAAPRGEKERQAEKRSQYFHDALYERSGRNSAVEAVRREALVYAEVKTNVAV